MQEIINYGEGTFYGVKFEEGTFYFRENSYTRKPKIFQKCDAFQKVIDAYITNPFFFWLCLTLILNKKNWKKPINIILILHWFLKATGDLLRNTMQLRTKEPDKRWPFSNTNWLISNAIAHIFWLTGEMVGDWYPLLRTKAVVNDTKKMYPVYITCILFNLTKVFGMISFFIDYPIDLRKMDKEKNIGIYDIYIFNIWWWSAVCAINVMSCLYDTSVIIALRSCLFNQLKKYKINKVNPMFENFKQISEYRIIISMLAAFLFLPFAVMFTSFVVYEYKNKAYNKLIKSDTEIEQFRNIVLNFNYTLMYIDQILLRHYVNNKEKTIIMKSRIPLDYLHEKSSTLNSQSHTQSLLHSSNDNTHDLYNSSPILYSSNILELGEPPYDWLDYSKLEKMENYNNSNNNNNNNNMNDGYNNNNRYYNNNNSMNRKYYNDNNSMNRKYYNDNNSMNSKYYNGSNTMNSKYYNNNMNMNNKYFNNIMNMNNKYFNNNMNNIHSIQNNDVYNNNNNNKFNKFNRSNSEFDDNFNYNNKKRHY